MSGLLPMMGAPQQIQGGLLGAAQNYGYPLTSGLLSHIGNAGGVGPWALTQAGPQASPGVPDYTQEALQLAGNPHAGPYANAPSIGASLPPVAGSPGTSGSSGGSSAGSSAMGLLGALAKNPSLVKNGVSAVQGLLGGGLSSFGSQAAAGTASELGAAAAPALAADTAAALVPAVGSAATAAELGTTADALAPIVTSGAAGGAAAGAGGGAAAGGAGGTAAGGAALGAAGALAGVALPIALAAFMPDNPGFGIGELQSMEQQIANATKANGGPINAGYALNPDGTINQAHSQTLNDLYTLIGDDWTEFKHAGGTGPIDSLLTSLGYGNLLAPQQPITSPAPGGRGWLGGGYTGKSRV